MPRLVLLLQQFAFNDSARVNSSRVDFQIEQLPIRPAQNVRLLCLENFHVLCEDCRLTIANPEGQSSIIGLKVASHSPVIPG
jgi:hypothetical protein